MCQKAFVCVTICAFYLPQLFDQLLHPHTQPSPAPPPPPLAGGWVEPVTVADTECWRCTVARSFDGVDMISRIGLSLSLSLAASLPAWHGRSEFEAPNYCVSPHGCVLICHIMSHLQRSISNIPSITGRLKGEFKIALLQAIWVCGTQMCSLSYPVWHTCTNTHTYT